MAKEVEEEYSDLPICILHGEGGWEIITSDIPDIVAA